VGLGVVASASIVLAVSATVSCGGSTKPPQLPPSLPPELQLTHEMDDFAFELGRIIVGCFRASGPQQPGLFAITVDMDPPHSPPRISDSGSTPGNERALACVTGEGQARLTNPERPLGRFLGVTLPLPARDLKKLVFEVRVPADPQAASPQR
jgi:hypothetical protein